MADVRIVIVDDHPLVREGLKLLLRDEADLHVVGDAHDGQSALALCESLQPAVALVDLVMPGMTGWQLIAALKRRCPTVRSVVVSAQNSEEFVAGALDAGACGYVTKSAPPEELVRALRAVSGCGDWLPATMSRDAIIRHLDSIRAKARDKYLSPRQRDVLARIVGGASTKCIAVELGVSVKTVESHRTQIMARLDVRGTAELVRYAIRNGMAPL